MDETESIDKSNAETIRDETTFPNGLNLTKPVDDLTQLPTVKNETLIDKLRRYMTPLLLYVVSIAQFLDIGKLLFKSNALLTRSR